MVREIERRHDRYYLCEICKLTYETRRLAQDCEDWDKKYNSCNMDIALQSFEVRIKQNDN